MPSPRLPSLSENRRPSRLLARLVTVPLVTTLLAVAACGGAVEGVSAPDPGAPPPAALEAPEPNAPEDAPSPAPLAPPHAAPGARETAAQTLASPRPALPSTAPFPNEGVCAEYIDGLVGTVAGSPGEPCTVVVPDTSSGFAKYVFAYGDRGEAHVASNGTITLRCGTRTRVLFEASLRCVEASGNHVVAEGDLRIGGDASDRACRISLDVDRERMRGFLSCPNEPAVAGSVFAQSGAPIGLGHFDLPRTGR